MTVRALYFDTRLHARQGCWVLVLANHPQVRQERIVGPSRADRAGAVAKARAYCEAHGIAFGKVLAHVAPVA